VPKRRRPGQRAIASDAVGRSGYDLGKDRQIRARAKFERLSLGEAVSKYRDSATPLAVNARSYLARDEHDLLPTTDLSDAELDILIRLSVYAEGIGNSIKQTNPRLHAQIVKASQSVATAELERARRARHTPAVLAAARYLAELPTYKKLDLNSLSGVPY
jgi:hypothetical protein